MIGETERDGLQLVTALHDVVQPAGLPVLPSFEIYGRFCVPDDAVEPGGSWFDVVVLPDDRVALVVGEVPGIGLTAAVTAAQMRGVIRAGLRRDGDAVDALQLGDIHAEDAPDARGSTALVVLLDSERGIAAYASAGHPPPWLVPADGPPVLLSDTGGGPLGTGLGAPATPAPPAPGQGRRRAPGRLGGPSSDIDVRRPEPDGGEPRCRTVQRPGLVRGGRVVADGVARGLEVRLDGEVDPVRCARDQLGSWLAELGASPMDQMGVTHAAAELVTNAFEHGANGHGPWVELRARLGSNGVALVEVLDHGTWQVPVEDLTRGVGWRWLRGWSTTSASPSDPTAPVRSSSIACCTLRRSRSSGPPRGSAPTLPPSRWCTPRPTPWRSRVTSAMTTSIGSLRSSSSPPAGGRSGCPST